MKEQNQALLEGKIIGSGLSRNVYFDGKYLSPRRSQQLWNHSPDGFNWGYGGSGPAQLALAILLEMIGTKPAQMLHQSFKFDIISKLPQGKDFTLEIETVKTWIATNIK